MNRVGGKEVRQNKNKNVYRGFARMDADKSQTELIIGADLRILQ